MQIDILKEITGVVGEFTYQEHTYYVKNGDKLVAFTPAGSEELTVFAKPLRFSKSRRKFKKMGQVEWN